MDNPFCQDNCNSFTLQNQLREMAEKYAIYTKRVRMILMIQYSMRDSRDKEN